MKSNYHLVASLVCLLGIFSCTLSENKSASKSQTNNGDAPADDAAKKSEDAALKNGRASDPEAIKEALAQLSLADNRNDLLLTVNSLRSMLSDKVEIQKLIKSKGAAYVNQLLGDLRAALIEAKQKAAKLPDSDPNAKNFALKALDILGEINNIINQIIEIIDDIIDIVPEKIYNLGNALCGQLPISNDNLSEPGMCDKLAELVACMTAQCQPPLQVVTCDKEPNMEVCGLKSDEVCNIPPATCKVPDPAQDPNQNLGNKVDLDQ